MKNVQDIMNSFFSKNDVDNETVEVLSFVRDFGVPLTNDQAEGIFLLSQFGLNDVAEHVMTVRQHMTPYSSYTKMVEMMTLAHRIKGSAKLDNVLKQDANPGMTLNTDKAAKGR